MRENRSFVKGRSARKYCSYKGEISPEVPNVIQRNFRADKPNQKWLADVTEFSIPAGKVYLSPIIDCYDGMPVALLASGDRDHFLSGVFNQFLSEKSEPAE